MVLKHNAEQQICFSENSCGENIHIQFFYINEKKKDTKMFIISDLNWFCNPCVIISVILCPPSKSICLYFLQADVGHCVI